MDTRSKIMTASQAAASLPNVALVVSGWFDPLLAEHARLLADIPSQFAIAVQITDPPEPLLPARARAELVAALERVSIVILDDEANRLDAAVSLEAQEAELRSRFLLQVAERQS